MKNGLRERTSFPRLIEGEKESTCMALDAEYARVFVATDGCGNVHFGGVRNAET